MLTLAACDGGDAFSGREPEMSNSSAADAIQLASPNVRATLKVDVLQSGSGGSTLTLIAPTANYRLHSGTTSNGVFAFDLVALDVPKGLDDEARTLQIRNGVLTIADGENKLLAGGAVGLHTALGTQDGDPLTVMDGLVASTLPAVGSQTSRDGGTAEVTQVRPLGTGGRTQVTIVTQTGEPGAAPVVQHRIYTRRNLKYVMDEMTTTVTETDASGGTTTQQTRLQFANVTWPQFEVSDMAAAAATAPGGGWGQYADSQDPCGTPEVPNCPPPVVDPDVPPDTGDPTNPGGGGGPGGCSQITGGANLVYVHGINATGSNWGSETANNAVRGKNRCDLQVGWDDAPSLTAGGLKGLGRHAQQATELQGSPALANRSELIFVGHSQGGLISRRAAQTLQSEPGKVRGLVTTGTPHRGARVALSLSTLGIPGRVSRLFQPGSYACRVRASGCSTVQQAANAAEDMLPTAVLSSEAMLDLRPASPAINFVNSQTENFRRFAIQNHLTSHGMLLYQVLGDFGSTNRGRLVREIVTAVMLVALTVAIVGAVASIFKPWAAIVAIKAALAFRAIIGAELAWIALSYGSGPSDGVVEGSSQLYPASSPGFHSPVNRLSLDPSSHTAQIDSERSAEDIQRTLRQGLNVQPRQ